MDDSELPRYVSDAITITVLGNNLILYSQEDYCILKKIIVFSRRSNAACHIITLRLSRTVAVLDHSGEYGGGCMNTMLNVLVIGSATMLTDSLHISAHLRADLTHFSVLSSTQRNTTLVLLHTQLSATCLLIQLLLIARVQPLMSQVRTHMPRTQLTTAPLSWKRLLRFVCPTKILHRSKG
jgi:hypothetical protein